MTWRDVDRLRLWAGIYRANTWAEAAEWLSGLADRLAKGLPPREFR